MIRILIIDNSHDPINNIDSALSREKDMMVAAHSSDVFDAFSRIASLDLDIVIIDISKPEYSGFFVLEQINKSESKPATLMISTLREDVYSTLAKKCGANGYLSKSLISSELAKAIREIVINNKKYFHTYALDEA